MNNENLVIFLCKNWFVYQTTQFKAHFWRKLYKCILIEIDTAIWATYSQYFHPYWETVFCSFLGLRQKQTEWFQRSLYTTVRRLFLGDLILIEWPKGLKAVLYCTFYICIRGVSKGGGAGGAHTFWKNRRRRRRWRCAIILLALLLAPPVIESHLHPCIVSAH